MSGEDSTEPRNAERHTYDEVADAWGREREHPYQHCRMLFGL